MTAIDKINAQQEKLTKDSAPWVVGEQLKEICEDAHCAELVCADLDNEDMSITACEKKIKAYADEHKTGIFAFVSPNVAEGIIREFYGLPERGERKAPTAAADIISLEDYM